MPHPTVERALVLRKKLVELHREIYDFVQTQHPFIKTMGGGAATQVDFGFLLREMAEYAEQIRKDANQAQDLTGQVLAFALAQQSLQDPNVLAEPTRGEFANGTIDIKQMPQIPKDDTPESKALLAELGIPPACIGLVRPRYTEVEIEFNKRIAAGKGLPGITKSWPVYKTIYVRKRGVTF